MLLGTASRWNLTKAALRQPSGWQHPAWQGRSVQLDSTDTIKCRANSTRGHFDKTTRCWQSTLGRVYRLTRGEPDIFNGRLELIFEISYWWNPVWSFDLKLHDEEKAITHLTHFPETKVAKRVILLQKIFKKSCFLKAIGHCKCWKLQKSIYVSLSRLKLNFRHSHKPRIHTNLATPMTNKGHEKEWFAGFSLSNWIKATI